LQKLAASTSAGFHKYRIYKYSEAAVLPLAQVGVNLVGRVPQGDPCKLDNASTTLGCIGTDKTGLDRRSIDRTGIERTSINRIDEKEKKGKLKMKIDGAIALVTGANRGIGRAFVEALVVRGAKRIYATARDPAKLKDLENAHPGKIHVLALDITRPAQVAAAASQAGDVNLLINNAGINRKKGLIASAVLDDARDEMDTNYFGTLNVARAFAPILKHNGGGVMVNMLSILARVSLPAYGSLCASKAAGLLATQGIRAELASQHTRVIAVMPGAVDTDMERDFEGPKEKPEDIANASLQAVEDGADEVYPGGMAQGVSQGLSADPKAVETEFSAYLPG